MSLEELLWVINDSTIVELYNGNQDKIAEYDGKDSIPEEYNEWPVIDIFVEGNKLCIEIEGDDEYDND